MQKMAYMMPHQQQWAALSSQYGPPSHNGSYGPPSHNGSYGPPRSPPPPFSMQPAGYYTVGYPQVLNNFSKLALYLQCFCARYKVSFKNMFNITTV